MLLKSATSQYDRYKDISSLKNQAIVSAMVLGGSALGAGIGASPLGTKAQLKVMKLMLDRKAKKLGMYDKDLNDTVISAVKNNLKTDPSVRRSARETRMLVSGLGGTVLGTAAAIKHNYDKVYK